MNEKHNQYIVGFQFKVNKDYFSNEVQVREFSGYSFIFDADNVYILSEKLFKISDSEILKTTIKPYSLEEVMADKYFTDFELTGCGNTFAIVEYGEHKYIFKDGEDASEFLNIIQLIDAGKLLRREAFKTLKG